MALIDDAMARQKGRVPGSAGTFFPCRRRAARIAVAAVSVCALLFVIWQLAVHLPSTGRSGSRKNDDKVQSHGPVDGFSIRGVQVGRYETKAIIDGELVRRGEKIRCGKGSMLFLGVNGKDLLFEDERGEIHRRQFMPDVDGSN